MKHLIEATIIIGKFKGEDLLIPIIPLMPTDFAFEFKRVQFTVSLAFAMSINKSQGQSLEECGIHLARESANHRRYLFLSPYGKQLNIFYTTRHYNKVSAYDNCFVL